MVKTRNRNPVTRFFITFPQWKNSSKLKLISEHKTLNIDKYLICKELHTDKNEHYHLIFILNKGMTWKKMVKWYEERYPDDFKRIKVETVKSLPASVKYVKKDGDYIGNLEEKQQTNVCTKIYNLCKSEYKIFCNYFNDCQCWYWTCKEHLKLFEPSFREKYIRQYGQMAHAKLISDHRKNCQKCQ